jgi:hypothetical protein
MLLPGEARPNRAWRVVNREQRVGDFKVALAISDLATLSSGAGQVPLTYSL